MGSARRSSISISIGEDVGVEVFDSLGAALLPDNSVMYDFPGRGPASLTLQVRRGRLPEFDLGEPLFDCQGRWKAFRNDRNHVLVLYTSGSKQPYSMAVIDFHHGHGELFVSAPPEAVAYPFFYPIDEIIFSKLLADRGGFIAHACGIDYRGRGLLLLGHSGAGKSTLAELFVKVPGARVLSDDRVAVWVRDGHVAISGTPWHGTSAFASQETTRLEQILFLSHGAHNRHRTLSPGRAAARLVALSVLPAWDRPALEKTLAASGRIAEMLPAAELEFVPDQTAVTCVLETLPRVDR